MPLSKKRQLFGQTKGGGPLGAGLTFPAKYGNMK